MMPRKPGGFSVREQGNWHPTKLLKRERKRYIKESWEGKEEKVKEATEGERDTETGQKGGIGREKKGE